MASDIGLVLHPRRDPGHVLDAIRAWAKAHGSRLLKRPADAALGRNVVWIDLQAEPDA